MIHPCSPDTIYMLYVGYGDLYYGRPPGNKDNYLTFTDLTPVGAVDQFYGSL
jgi:hypothetical protein